MKKILLLGTVFALFTFAASAQHTKNDFRSDRGSNHRFDQGQMTRGEKARLDKNDRQYHRTKKWFKKDGKISRSERRKLAKMKHHDRRETYRYRHNDRRRMM